MNSSTFSKIKHLNSKLVVKLISYCPVTPKFAEIMSKSLSPEDPSSYSRPDLVKVTDISINWILDFDKKIISGNVKLLCDRIDSKAKELVLDSKDLKIQKIYEANTSKELQYVLDAPFEEFGSKLTVKFDNTECKEVVIEYETSPNASGLQWLSPEQTAGKKHPYLFSQFQAIHARSVLPCQDTPSVKARYKATVKAPKDLTVLMSALRNGTSVIESEKISEFDQPVPIPSYLIAIAAGALESRDLSNRSKVWCEKEFIDKCAYEFADTELQLQTAENICGPYVWGIYDLLVLPPSFPFGGMENPCLTFVTPTLLAGDRSLANVIAHEIAHSWTGNLVTNKNFEHFWLNEGFTVFVERKIKGRLESNLALDFDAHCRLYDLQEGVNTLGVDSPLTKLVVNLTNGTHPDDAFSIVPYEKGYTFLRYLETIVGGPSKFEPFLKIYLDKFKFQSIITEDFKKFFEDYFKDNVGIKKIDWDKWLYTVGMPLKTPEYNLSLAKECDDFIREILSENEGGIDATKANSFSTEQRIYILQKLLSEAALTVPILKRLDEMFNLSTVINSELKFRWFRLGIKAKYQEIVDPVLSWINEVGRMKFVRPLYRDLYEWEFTREKVIENFKKYKPYMMHVVAYTVAKDLHLTS